VIGLADALPGSRPTSRDFALYAAIPAVLTVIAIMIFWSIGSFAGDFRDQYWSAGLRVLHGQSPYLLSQLKIDKGLAFPYPPLGALLFVPFALIARGPSEILFTLVCFGSLAGTFMVLGVRDWRIYGIVLLWLPVINAWQSANLTLPLILLIALVWRYRHRPAVAGIVTAVAISLKPFVWPLLVWLVATRRYRAAGVAALTGLVVNLLAVAIVGFDQVSRYLTDASRVSGAFYRIAYTPLALTLHLGIGRNAATAVEIAAAAAAAVACLAVGRRGDDLGALTLLIVLTLLATPVLWMHYFALALVPLAIARPRLEPIWALPIVLIVCGTRSTWTWEIVLALGVMGTVLLASGRRRSVA
jgi:hypothetical protein